MFQIIYKERGIIQVKLSILFVHMRQHMHHKSIAAHILFVQQFGNMTSYVKWLGRSQIPIPHPASFISMEWGKVLGQNCTNTLLI